MVINEIEVNKIISKDVFTDKGAYCGKITDVELDLSKFRIRTIIVDAAKGSYLATIVGGKRGVKVPYQMVHSVGDIVIVKHIKPQAEDEEPESAPKAQ